MDAAYANTVKGRAPLRASYEIRSALAQRGAGVGSISYFYSPKNHCDLVISSDIKLLYVLTLEGRADVDTYDLDFDRISSYLVENGYVGDKPYAVVTLRSGKKCLVEVKYSKKNDQDTPYLLKLEMQKEAAKKLEPCGVTTPIRTPNVMSVLFMIGLILLQRFLLALTQIINF